LFKELKRRTTGTESLEDRMVRKKIETASETFDQKYLRDIQIN